MSETTGVIVRDARADERRAVRELTLRAYAEYARIMAPSAWAPLEHALRAALAHEEDLECLVAEYDGRLVGSVRLYPPATDVYGGLTNHANWPMVRLLAVAPEARGLGVGRALMEECVRRARRTGSPALGLHTSQSMSAALRLYERMGFVRAPEYDFQPDGAELVLAYRLSLNEAETETEPLGENR